MSDIRYNPWGNIDWIMNKLTRVPQWDFLGNISTEERSLGAWDWLVDNRKIRHYEMWLIRESDSTSPFYELSEKEYKARIDQYKKKDKGAYLEFMLLESDTYASECSRSFAKESCGSVIVDISTMPKRWFFPVIKECIENNHIQNLLVTYTIPKHYSKIQGEDPMAWKYFPSFGELPEREGREKIFIISAGYQPLSLPQWISNYEDTTKYILFPFPASISGYSRAWDFIITLESDCGPIEKSWIKYISGFNLPVIYDTVCKIISDERKRTSNEKEFIFSPYGPKPVSLAFAMIASQGQFPVGYTQPAYYNPFYSTGIEMARPKVPKIMSYLLKVNGRNLYSPPEISF